MKRRVMDLARWALLPALHFAVTGTMMMGSLMGGPGTGQEVFGAGVSAGEPVTISEILSAPERFQGKRVLVKGRVKAVCPKRGCWMELEDSTGARIQVKVEDGVIVFPVSLVGREAVAEGVVEVLDLSKEQYLGWLRHQAEEAGRPFDPEGIGDGPYRIIRIRGVGAQVGF